MRDVEDMANSYFEIAREKGFDGWLGTAYNEIDVDMHLCAILGRMVGHTDEIAHLEPPQPDEDADGREFMIASNSLNNWVIAAKYHHSIDDDSRKRIWNLDCVGKFDIPDDLWVNAPDGYLVEYDADRSAIMIQGDITEGFAEAVIDAIATYPEAKVISLGSGGGAVYEAIRAGMAIRSAGLETELINNCYSACPLALAGGTVRFMWWPFKEVGLHQVSSYGSAIPLSAPVYRHIAVYLAEMGLDPIPIIEMMWSSPPSEMFIVEEQLRCDTRIITNHQRGCLSY
ncbi:hypothetical protein SAMN04488004_11668 [Loktanella salsilacus]|uniref:Uncharacterized protein n=2 Tax=Loktanella salsilacus TaxID=195913 RepID=A0A1I4H9R7_9RHOB|nr:hypothetical protein SAMN04488004_11668 [Loktanella salsilacus]